MANKISEHFWWKEFEVSNYAKRHDIDNSVPKKYRKSIADLCENVLEAIRKEFGSITISSGYRCPELNKGIGGSLTSQHSKGQAADLQFRAAVDLEKVFEWVKENLDYDQVIYEFDSWIHVSFNEGKNRNKSLIAYKKDGKTKYKAG